MIFFTEAAKKHIIKSVNKQGGGHFRLWIKTTGCSGYMYMPEVVTEPKATDIEVTEFNGIKIYLADDAPRIVAGTTVDYIEKMTGFGQLSFDNPNATSLCGCGESFKLVSEKK